MELIDLLLQAAADHLLTRAKFHRALFGQDLYPYQITVAAIQVRDYGGRRPLIPSVAFPS